MENSGYHRYLLSICGLVVSGLSVFSYRFGVLPPFFQLENEEDEAVLVQLIKTLFPDLEIELWPILKHGIASLALREDFYVTICLLTIAPIGIFLE